MGSCCSSDHNNGPKTGPVRQTKEMSLSKKIAEGGVKIVLLGDMSTGKTCMVLRLVNDEFSSDVEPTIGAAFLVHKMSLDNRTVKLEIWDTAGQERFKTLAPMYYRGASAAVIVYDITKTSSFEVMTKWVDELKQRAPPNIVLAIAGNKCDLASERMVQQDTVEAYLKQLTQEGGKEPIFRECSAKSGQGIRELFEEICRKLIEMAENEV